MNAQEAILILQRYRSGESTPAENQLVDSWYQRLVTTGEWQWGEGEKEELEAIIKNRLLQQLDDSQAIPVHRVHFLRTSWFRYAAAVILLTGGVAVWWEISQPSQQSPLPPFTRGMAADVQPGTNRAILTVGSNTINLSNNKTGIAVNNTIAYNDGEKITGSLIPLVKGGRGDLVQMLQLTTPRGGQYQAVLPDGTKVWLNAASSIKFPSRFTGGTREVEVTGEAYLEVAKNTKQPFYVHTNKETIQVLGTSFNVNAYGDEEIEKTTLVTGSIRVVPIPLVKGGRGDLLHNQDGIILKPGQQAAVVNNRLSVADNQSESALAWKNGFFNMEGADLQQVVRQLERWYDIQVKYEGEMPVMKFKGQIDRGIRLSGVLRWFSDLGIKTRLEGKTLIVVR